MALECGHAVLRGGVRMPLLGFGTYCLRGPACVAAVEAALTCGYRLLDTAAVYRNEADVAEGLRRSGVPRADVFITSKLRPHDAGPPAYDACLASLAALGTPYLDLYLIHWPGRAGVALGDAVAQRAARRESWRALRRLLREGRVRAIGVSNFTPAHLAQLEEDAAADDAADAGAGAGGNDDDGGRRPSVNQVELHPLLQQRHVVAACAARGVVLQAYSSLARGAPALLAHPHVAAAAAAHGVTPGQVALRWALQRGFAVIPKSASRARIVENAGALRWRLGDAEMAALDALEDAVGSTRTCWDPHTVA